MRNEFRSINQLLSDRIVLAQPTPVALTGATNTITAASIIAGIVTINGGTTAAVTSTLGTAALLDAALISLFSGFPVGYSVDFSVINISTDAGEDATVTTATGWTLVGSMVVAANATLGQGGSSSGRFRALKTANSAYTLYRIA